MLRAPRNKGNLEVKYESPLGAGGQLETSANYSYTAGQRGELEPYAIQPAYGLFDARLTWVSPQSEYEVSLWGRNLANKAWIAHVYTIANEVFGVYGEPRTYGVSLSWHLRP
jgi:iron complex outermembrane receptor protein